MERVAELSHIEIQAIGGKKSLVAYDARTESTPLLKTIIFIPSF